MTEPNAASNLVVAIDAMSGEHGPAAAVDATLSFLDTNPNVRAVMFGAARALEPHAKAMNSERLELREAESVVSMDAGPRDALRHGRGSSMWRAIDMVGDGAAHVALSAGNTAALMAMATHRLRAAPGVPKPAIAALWPSRGPAGFNVVLDMGAGLDADCDALVGYAVMGAAYARVSLGMERPRVGLLNVGAERGKGRAALRAAAEQLEQMMEERAAFRFVGFVEGDQIPSNEVDVVVTDGFSGNIALKTAEGTARLIGDFTREAFSGSLLRRLASLVAYPALKALSRRVDPRQVNGGVFLGLNGVVVKSHGAADAVAFASALRLAHTIGRRNLSDVVADELTHYARISHDPVEKAAHESAPGRLGKA